jgi:hypothetical protein
MQQDIVLTPRLSLAITKGKIPKADNGSGYEHRQLLLAASFLDRSEQNNATKGRIPMSFSLVPLLLGNKQISTEVRKALVENRLQDAAELIMRQYGLDCIEASHLLNVAAC